MARPSGCCDRRTAKRARDPGSVRLRSRSPCLAARRWFTRLIRPARSARASGAPRGKHRRHSNPDHGERRSCGVLMSRHTGVRVIFGVVPARESDTIPVVRSVPGATRRGRTSETMKSEPDKGENRSVNPPGGTGAVPENIKPRKPILSWGFVGLIFSRYQRQFRLSLPSVPSAQPVALAYDARRRLFCPIPMSPARSHQRLPVPNTAYSAKRNLV